jgi:signal peptidase I
MDDEVQATPSRRKQSAPQSGWRTFWDWVKAIAIALIIAFCIHQFMFQQFVVKGDSMVPTLLNGERLLVDKIPFYFGPPKRGDIIVFRAPKAYAEVEGADWVKRVIGLPGDTIMIRDGQLYINHHLIHESFINGPMDPYRNFGPEKVPPGHLFVMGDNRNISLDSRVIGPIPISSVIGRVDLIFWPLSKFQVLGSNEQKLLPQFP